MKTSHLNDNEIQRFIFDKSECDSEAIAHINSCEVCKNRTEAYLTISTNIKEQLDPILEFDLSTLVYNQLETSDKNKSPYNFFIYFLLAISIGVVALLASIFTGIFIDLFSDTKSMCTFLIIGIAGVLAIALVIDLVSAFNKKVKIINLYSS